MDVVGLLIVPTSLIGPYPLVCGDRKKLLICKTRGKICLLECVPSTAKMTVSHLFVCNDCAGDN